MSITPYATANRKARIQIARDTRSQVGALNAILLDPDLSPEAKHRKAAPLRAALRTTVEDAKRNAMTEVEHARHAAIRTQPSAARRAEAFAKPERAIALRTLLEQVQSAELHQFATMAVDEKDLAAAYAIGEILAKRAPDMSPTDVQAIRDTLDGPFAAAQAAARADFFVAHAEALRLTEEGDTLVNGQASDVMHLAAMANAELSVTITPGQREALSTADLAAMYTRTGIPLARPAELLALTPAAVEAFRIMDDPKGALNDANLAAAAA